VRNDFFLSNGGSVINKGVWCGNWFPFPSEVEYGKELCSLRESFRVQPLEMVHYGAFLY